MIVVDTKVIAYFFVAGPLAEDLGTHLLTTDEAVVREFPQVAIHLDDFVS